MTFSCPCHLPSRHLRPKLGTTGMKTTALCSVASTQPAVLIQDSRVVPTAPATAQELLSQHRSWSYTTALVRNSYQVVDWNLHLQRLLRCVQGLSQLRRAHGSAAGVHQQAMKATIDTEHAMLHCLLATGYAGTSSFWGASMRLCMGLSWPG